MDTSTTAINRVAEEFGIGDKVSRAYELLAELEPLLEELAEYGFVSPKYIYMAPFGDGKSERGCEFVDRAFKLMLEIDANNSELPRSQTI